MRASHKIVAVLGVLACFVMVVFFRTTAEVVGEDDSQLPYTGLWVYTPYEVPGGLVAAKIFLQGGDRVSASNLRATIDGQPAVIEGKEERERRSGKRFDMGKRDIDLHVVLPSDLARGEHRLGFDLEGGCTGSSFSKACGPVHLEASIDVGSNPMRIWAVLRALLAAAAVWFGARYGKPRVVAWLRDSGKAGSALASAFIPPLIFWAYAGYTQFARPLGAGLGTASDALFGVAIVGWLVLLPVALVWKGKPGSYETKPSIGAIRFVEEPPEPGSTGSYRTSATTVARKRNLDELCALLGKHQMRVRRSGKRLVPRLLWGAPLTFIAEDPADVTRGVLRVYGNYGFILLIAPRIAAELGAFDLELDGKAVRVERDATSQAIAFAFR
jgi:hypothetical protein